MKVMFTGSRDWPRQSNQFVHHVVKELPALTTVVVGDARGVDFEVAIACCHYGLSYQVFVPDWDGLGRKAGLVRNTQMVNEKPDLCIAFWDGSSRGTKHAMWECVKARIPVLLVKPDGSRTTWYNPAIEDAPGVPAGL